MRQIVVQFWLNRRVGFRWTQDPQGVFIRRTYRSYHDYLKHQRSKLERLDLSDYDTRFREALRARLLDSPLLPPHASVLCLAARLGTEVKAFLDAGSFAIGIDLNPSNGNRYVVSGDFHDLQFADASVDVVFTNSLDHAFDIDRVVAEARRVLKPGGHFVVEAVKGTADNKNPRFFESFWWTKIDDLIEAFTARGFVLAIRQSIACPWEGEQLWLRRV